MKNSFWGKIAVLLLYICIAPPALAAIRDSVHGTFSGVMIWDLAYNVIGGAGGGIIQVVRNLQTPRKYSNNIAVELALSMVISAFAGLLTYLFVAGTEFISVNGLMTLFMSCCAGVLGYEAIKLYTDDFTKKVVKGGGNAKD